MVTRRTHPSSNADAHVGPALPGTVGEGTLTLESYSVFKSGARAKIAELMKSCKGDRLAVFDGFMQAENYERGKAAGNADEWGIVDDAANVFLGVFSNTRVCGKDYLKSGSDVKAVRFELNASLARVDIRPAVKDMMRGYVNVYFAVRDILFPEYEIMG